MGQGLSLMLICACALLAAESRVPDDVALERVLSSVRRGSSRLYPQDEQLLAHHPDAAIPAILEGMKGVDPLMFEYVVRNLAPSLNASQRAKMIDGLLELAKSGNLFAINSMAPFTDRRAFELFRTQALDSGSTVQGSALEALRFQAVVDSETKVEGRAVFQSLAFEPSPVGIRAAEILAQMYDEGEPLQRLKKLRDEPFRTLESAAKAIQLGRPWEREKAIREAPKFGKPAIPVLLSIAGDKEASPPVARSISSIVAQRPRDITRDDVQAITKAFKAPGASRHGYLTILTAALPNEAALDAVIDFANDQREINTVHRESAIYLLMKVPSPRKKAVLATLLADSNPLVATSAGAVLAYQGDKRGHSIAVKVLQEVKYPIPLDESGKPKDNDMFRAALQALRIMHAIGTGAELDLLSTFKKPERLGGFDNFIWVDAFNAIHAIRMRESPDDAARLAYAKDQWERTANDPMKHAILKYLSGRELAEYFLSVLQNPSAHKSSKGAALEHLYGYGWISREDQFKDAKMLRLRKIPTPEWRIH